MGEADLVFQSRFKIVRDALALPAAVVVTVVGVVAFLAGNTEVALYALGSVALFIAPELPYLRSYLEALTRRRVALRADREGITFGARPGRPVTDAEFIPWSETSAVLLWRAGRGLKGVRYVGVQRRDGPSPMWTITTEPLVARIGDAFRPWHQPRRETGDQRRVHGWRLDRLRLKAVVAQVWAVIGEVGQVGDLGEHDSLPVGVRDRVLHLRVGGGAPAQIHLQRGLCN